MKKLFLVLLLLCLYTMTVYQECNGTPPNPTVEELSTEDESSDLEELPKPMGYGSHTYYPTTGEDAKIFPPDLSEVPDEILNPPLPTPGDPNN